MNPSASWIREFYDGLQVFEEFSFPKTCATCGANYASLEDFITKTDDVEHPSGLTAMPLEKAPLVALFRNCTCGSTLMQGFEDRRDSSPPGRRRREQFGKLLDMLEAQGLDRQTARQEMLRILNGKDSAVLGRMGVGPDPAEEKGDKDGTEGS